MSYSALLLIPLLFAQAEVPDKTDLAEEQSRLRKVLDESVAWDEFFPDAESKTPMKVVPVHRWTNNERDPHGQGLAVLWVSQGRAVAVGSIYPWQGRLIHELDSLSRGTFVCRRDGAVIWRPQRGIPFEAVPNAEPPDESAPARLRQMKVLADEFSVTMLGWKPDNSDREELRRLPKEFFRFKPEQPDCLDGAVFAFVKGTDPEALLVLEAVPVKGMPQWQFAFARQTSGGLEARHKDRVVWTVEKHVPRGDPTQPFFSIGTPLPRTGEKTSIAE